MEAINLVWLKRDLRLQDHAPLAAAAEKGLPTIICYCFEPNLLGDAHIHESHQRFIIESLTDLSSQLKSHQLDLHVFWCDFVTLLNTIKQYYVIKNLFSHEETGVLSTYNRDQSVAQWCQQHQVQWTEFAQFAVQRGQTGRRGWSEFADHFLEEPLAYPKLSTLKTFTWPEEHPLNALKCKQLPSRWLQQNSAYQRGGEREAHKQLNHFLESAIQGYCFHISKPATSRYFSSRLSSYLAYGNVSLRSVLQALHMLPSSRHRSAFYSRMRWHCHFIQKFESDCRIEFEPLNPAYTHLLNRHQQTLDPVQQADYFDAWATGHTGYPLIDACMRSLLHSGFVNFRMRSMLVSVACHHLQLDWKPVALHLARHFLDFEPGIHYPQIQMQAGLTGFNTLRIYNPVQQSLKQDAEARFITEYLPELKEFPIELRHQPWLITPMELQMLPELPSVYSSPLFDLVETGRAARERLWAWRNSPEVKARVPALLRTQVSSHA